MAASDEILAALQAEPSFFTNFGNALSGAELPYARTNAQALLGPLALGLTAGLAQGYGKKLDKQANFDLFRQNDLLSALAGAAAPLNTIGPVADGGEYSNLLKQAPFAAYQSSEPPPNWTVRQGQMDLLKALGAQQAQEAAAAQQSERDFELTKVLAPKGFIVQGGEIQVEPTVMAVLESVAARKKNEFELSQSAKEELGKSFATIQEADTVAKMLENSNQGWGEYQLMKMFGAADKKGVGVAMKNLVDRLARARTGAQLNKEEEKLYDELVGGDISVDPKHAAKLLRKLAEAEGRYINSRIDAERLISEGPESVRAKIAEMDAARGRPAMSKATNIVTGPDGQLYEIID
jgi:hypothetical protein